MFKKLKQKVTESSETLDRRPSSPMPRRHSNQVDSPAGTIMRKGLSRNSSTNLKKAESTTSLSGSDIDMSYEAATKEELLPYLVQKSGQIKKLEIKVSEYSQSLKECTRERDKLMTTLEKQQDAAMRKFSELETTNAENKKKMEGIISELKEKEHSLKKTIKDLTTENEKLLSEVNSWKKKEEEFMRSREEFFAKRDNSEELQDLQMQELAKVKHMLMNSEKECKRHEVELDEHIAQLMQCREANDELESSLRSSTETLDSTRKSLESEIAARLEITSQKASREAIVSKFKQDNLELTEKTAQLKMELKQTRSNLSALESAHSSVCEKYQGLRHSSEAVLAKATSQLDEKESTITHLQTKIFSLEQRITTENLPENEQVQALLTERTILENRLEESHQQLNNIKSTWSTKINQLENQVSNLNAKIIEDNEEITAKSNELSLLMSTSKEKISELTFCLKTIEEEYQEVITQNENFLQQVTMLEAKVIEQTAQCDIERTKSQCVEEKLNSKAKEAEKDFRTQIDQLHNDLDKSQNKIDELQRELQSIRDENSTKELESMKKIEIFQEEIKNKTVEISNRDRVSEEMALALEDTRLSREKLREECKQMEDDLRKIRFKLSESEEKVNAVTKDRANYEKNLSEKQKRINEVEMELKNITALVKKRELDLKARDEGYMMLSNSQKLKDSEVEALSNRVEQLASTLQAREEELMNCKEEIANLKNNFSEDNEVASLKADKTKLNEKLAERDRSIRLQQQRLSDLKKALNKELTTRSSGTVNGPSHQTSNFNNCTGTDILPSLNGAENTVTMPVGYGNTAIDDPSLSMEQREVTVKYLKHVVLTFLSCGVSEAQQLVKALSMLLTFTKEEEKYVKDILEYRTSWFGSKPTTKKVIKPSYKHNSRR